MSSAWIDTQRRPSKEASQRWMSLIDVVAAPAGRATPSTEVEAAVTSMGCDISKFACKWRSKTTEAESLRNLTPQHVSESEHVQVVASQGRPRRASAQGRLFAKAKGIGTLSPIGAKPDASKQITPSSEKNDAPKKKITQLRSDASRLLHFCLFGDTREVGKHGLDLQACHKDKATVRNQLDVVDQLLLQFNVKISDVPKEMSEMQEMMEQETKKLSQGWNIGRYNVSPFTDEAKLRLSKNFKSLQPDTSFPFWVDWASADCKGVEDDFLSKLVPKITQQICFGKNSFIRDDLLRLLWPCASSSEIEAMRQIRPLSKPCLLRLPVPPVIDPDEYDDLCRVFESIDYDDVGKVSFEVMMEHGFVHPSDMIRTCQLWDMNVDGLIDKLEFCQMMCKSGFRATQDSTVATLYDGTRILMDPQDGTWRVEERDGPGGSTRDSLQAPVADDQSPDILLESMGG